MKTKTSVLFLLTVLSAEAFAKDNPPATPTPGLSAAVKDLEQVNTPAVPDCPNDPNSCSVKYVGRGTNQPTICGDYDRNQNAFLAEYADGTVAVNPIALDETLGAMEAARTRNISRSERNARSQNPRLMGMIDTVTPNPAVRQRFDASIELLKSTLRDQITQGRPDSELNPHARYLANRIDHLEVRMESGMDLCVGEGGHPFNARYQGTSNTMYVCPFLSNLTPDAYLPLLAHELGHFSDPCNYAELYRFNDSIRGLSLRDQPARITSEINRCLSNVPRAQRNRFIQWATGGTRLESRGLPFYQREGASNPNRPLAERLRACGIVSAPDSHPPTTYTGSPYLPILSCVNQRHSTFHAPIAENATISSDTCEPGRDGRAMETVADYVSSSVIARMMNRNPNYFQRPEAIPTFYTAVHCGGADDPTYLANWQRLTVFLRPPGMQRFLNCDGSALESMCPIPDSLTGAGR